MELRFNLLEMLSVLDAILFWYSYRILQQKLRVDVYEKEIPFYQRIVFQSLELNTFVQKKIKDVIPMAASPGL